MLDQKPETLLSDIAYTQTVDMVMAFESEPGIACKKDSSINMSSSSFLKALARTDGVNSARYDENAWAMERVLVLCCQPMLFLIPFHVLAELHFSKFTTSLLFFRRFVLCKPADSIVGEFAIKV